MFRIDPDAAHAAEFPEYSEILPVHQMAVYSDPEELFVGQKFETKEECVFAIKRYSMNISVDYKVARFQYRVSYRNVWIAKQMAMEQLYGNFDVSYNELQGWIAAMRENVLPIAFAIVDKENIESWEFFLTNLRRRSGLPWRSVYCIRHIAANFHRDYKNADWNSQVVKMDRRMAMSMNVEVYSRRNETFRVTETIGRRPACAKVSFNLDQFIDEVYTLERTLHIWENVFLVLPGLSTWEVPRMTFELIPDKGLGRNPKGRPQSSRICNKMDIREKSDGKLCGGVRNIDEKSNVSNAIDELEPGGVENGDGYGSGGAEYSGGYEPKGAKYSGRYKPEGAEY
ncbi:hypothetical protein J1N35_030730 [Gossypium stocksii]|uniref:MULE transposase domain-containing protein n=1 Tax=Gossypium stocksii TaxID=47602 RepID=A0A9D3V0I3_9ROSI|nr:hypothetical protein J1N35_030730 [Gossypium stocksii]